VVAEYEDTVRRIEKLLEAADSTFRARFAETIDSIRDQFTLDELETLLERGRYDDALVKAEIAAANLASAYTAAYVMAAQDTAAFVANALSTVVRFDQTNLRAVEEMRLNQLRIIREFTEGQRTTTRMALIEGISQGLNPRQQALLFKESIGLTQNQWDAVNNFRRLLEANSAESLTRELRDGRYDRSIRNAINSGQVLSKDHIDRMVERYGQNMVTFRAETIARTESLAAVHQGVDQMFQQAVADGLIDSDLIQTWRNAGDARVRDSHSFMGGQQRPIGQPFLSGEGNLLRYPGDMNAPASDTAQCRCVKTTRFSSDISN
jgi:hypothetical protein